MSAILDGKIAKDNIGAVLEGYRLVGLSRGPAGGPRGDFRHVGDRKHRDRAAARVDIASVNQAGARDHDVVQAYAPDQAVLPVAVALVLKADVDVRLGGVIEASILARAGPLYGRPEDRIDRFKMQTDVAL